MFDFSAIKFSLFGSFYTRGADAREIVEAIDRLNNGLRERGHAVTDPATALSPERRIVGSSAKEIAEALYDRAERKLVEGSYTEAFTDVMEALRLNPGHGFALNLLSEIFWLAGRYEDAVIFAGHAIQRLGKHDTAAYLSRAHAYTKLGMFLEALSDMTYIVDREPSEQAYTVRAWVLRQLGRHSEADADEIKASRTEPLRRPN